MVTMDSSEADGREVPLQNLDVKQLPLRMDDWSKLDYFRFCLFQKQVQEEFLRENQALRSRLESVAPGTIRELLLEVLKSRPSMNAAFGATGDVTAVRKRPATEAMDMPASAGLRRRRLDHAAPTISHRIEVDGLADHGAARVPTGSGVAEADAHAWRREVERLAAPGELLEDSSSSSGTDAEEVPTGARAPWQEALLAAARGHRDAAPGSPGSLRPEPGAALPSALQLSPSRRSGRSGFGTGTVVVGAGPGSPSHRDQEVSTGVDATPTRLRSEAQRAAQQATSSGDAAPGTSTYRAVAPPSGDKIRRPRDRIPGDLRGLARLRQAVFGTGYKGELIKGESAPGETIRERA